MYIAHPTKMGDDNVNIALTAELQKNTLTPEVFSKKKHQKAQSILSLIIGYVECLFFVVSQLGWPSLVYIYRKNNLFSEWCQENVTMLRNVTMDEVSCSEDYSYYNLAYSITQTLQMLALFPLGFIFDRYGIFKTRIIGL